jgi:hypothetical protein
MGVTEPIPDRGSRRGQPHRGGELAGSQIHVGLMAGLLSVLELTSASGATALGSVSNCGISNSNSPGTEN